MLLYEVKFELQFQYVLCYILVVIIGGIYMPSRKEFMSEEKECAEMLGMTLKEYRNDLKNTKVSVYRSTKKKDNSILKLLGLNEKDLKTRKVL